MRLLLAKVKSILQHRKRKVLMLLKNKLRAVWREHWRQPSRKPIPSLPKHSNEGNAVHAYEVQKIKVLDEETPNTSNGVGTLNSELEGYPLAKVINNVGKSYKKDKKLLEQSKIADESTDLYRDPDEVGDILNDQSLGLQERITAAAARIASQDSFAAMCTAQVAAPTLCWGAYSKTCAMMHTKRQTAEKCKKDTRASRAYSPFTPIRFSRVHAFPSNPTQFGFKT